MDHRIAFIRCGALCCALTAAVGCAHDSEGRMNKVETGSLGTDVVISAEDGSFEFDSENLFTVPFQSDCPREPTTENFAEAEAGGARRVSVEYPGLENPLFGVLAFCGVRPEFKGSASRSYRIVVPEQYVRETEGARVSVVFEQYSIGKLTLPAWVLWISREPFPKRSAQRPAELGTSASQDPPHS